MRNNERNAETLPLASPKIKRELATFLLFFHMRAAASLLNCMPNVEFRIKFNG